MIPDAVCGFARLAPSMISRANPSEIFRSTSVAIGRTSTFPWIRRSQMSIVQQRPMTSREWGLLLLLSLLWGGSFFFVGVAVKELPPLTIVAARVTIAAALLWLTAPLTGLAPKRMLDHFAPLALMGLLNNAMPFVLIASGQT